MSFWEEIEMLGLCYIGFGDFETIEDESKEQKWTNHMDLNWMIL